MPGLIIGVPVSEGQVVGKGDKVIILESMKMENELKAPKGGVVKKLTSSDGNTVNGGELLLVME